MNTLKAPSLQSLLESDRGSNESLLAESLQLDIEELDDTEYSIPVVDTLPSLESILNELDNELDSISDGDLMAPTPTPSMDDYQRQGSILRHVVLQGITSQVGSAADRVGAGLASSCAIARMIAVGTSHGHILAFDSNQTLRWCSQGQAAQGAVSSLAFNEDSTRLLAGFARGHIIMIDSSSGDTIRSLTEVITPNTSVLHLKWAGRPALALASDSGGSVWSLNFTRRLGIRGCISRCLFSGARGEVCSMEPLLLGEESHPLKSYCIVALATLSKFFVVMIKPHLKVIKYHAMTGPAECLPLLAWQLVLIQAADTSRAIDPVLAAARGNQLFFHQICYNNGRINLLFLRHVSLGYNLLSVHWLGPKSLACLDTSEMLHLKDVRTNRELECIDMSGAGVVYNSAQFKGLATGGNVSPALALAGTFACYNSMVSQGTQLYMLGARSLHAVSVRAWSDRITHLTSTQRWTDAFELAIDGYRNAAERPRRQAISKDRILELLKEYCLVTSKTPEMCLGLVMSCIIEINELDLLWGELWDRLLSPDVYLCHLTDHIESGNLTLIAPSVAQALCEYWKNISPKKLEELIIKIDWMCLDLHQVLTISKKENLYKAQMHLNTKALNDYTISLTELIPKLTKDNAILGNCLLVYISSCLAGRGYPTGDIESDIIPSVKHEVLRCLTGIHSNNSSSSELPYPYLRQLLIFDTRETLNVLSLAFQEKEFSGELGHSHRQRIVNILLEIMTPDQATWVEIGCLLNFIAQQISERGLPEDQNLLDKIVKYLSMKDIDDETPRQHSEREHAWLELLKTDCLTHIRHDILLKMSRNAKCYRVVEYLLEKMKKYDEILLCYILDPLRHSELFKYITNYTNNYNRKILKQIYDNFENIFNINSEYITKIIATSFATNIKQFITLFDNNPNNLYIFLNNLLKEGIILDACDYENYINLLCQHNPENVEAFLKNNDLYKLETTLEIVKKYELHNACVYLYEKKGDYHAAFQLSLELLKESPESSSETFALQISTLCTRASEVLPENEKENLWFSFLRVILSRPDLTSITKNVLHAASNHVDLTKLVQLVLTSGTKTGNFGDIKHLLVGMLSNSRYETLLLQTTARILGKDLHDILAKEKRTASQGLCIKSIKCVICRIVLRNPMTKCIIFGSCGHTVHEECFQTSKLNNSNNEKYQCPRCGLEINERQSISLSEPNTNIINNANLLTTNVLQLAAPPRIGGHVNT